MGAQWFLASLQMKLTLLISLFFLVKMLNGRHLLVKREANPGPQQSSGRSFSRTPQNRFIFSQAGNAGLAGAALGAGTQYFLNQLLNPCRGGRRNNRKGTNNRFFTGNTAIDNGALGFVTGFAGSALFNNAFGNGCG